MKIPNDRQLFAMLAALIPNVDLEALDAEKVQAAIRNPKLLASALTALLNNDLRLTFVGTPVIDLDAPGIPEGLTLLPDEEQIKSRMTGKWTVDFDKLRYHLVPGQKEGLIGDNVRQLLEGQSVMRAALIDFGMANQAMLPESWKDGHARFAWGDIYSGQGRFLYVRCIYWDGSAWYVFYHCLGSGFDSRNPALILASQPSVGLGPWFSAL